MTERACRLIVALCVVVAVIAAALVFAGRASAATPSPVVHTVWVSVDSITSSTTDDANAVPPSATAAAAFVAQLNQYWQRESRGAITVVLGGFETRSIPSVCSMQSLFVSARATDFGGRFAATSAWSGTNQHLLAMSKESCGGTSVGQGSVGGNGGIMATTVGLSPTLGLAVVAHEFGHNLGLLHANAQACPVGIDEGAACATETYGDYLDIMGSAVPGVVPHLSSPQLIQLGYLTDYARLSQSTGTVRQTLAPLGATGGTQALRITDPSTGEVYFVEYRTPDPADAASLEFTSYLRCVTEANGLQRCSGGMSPAVGGVRVLRLTDAGTLVMAVGHQGTTHLDAGESFTNENDGFRVTVNTLSTTDGASLTIAFGSSITAAAVVAAPAQVAPTVAKVATVNVPAATPVLAAPALPAVSHVKVRLHHSTIGTGTKPVVTAIVFGSNRPTGTLTVYANGKRVKTARLGVADAGMRTITLPRRTSAGTTVITVRYSGSAKAQAAASVAKRLRVK